ncbi:hypothetical protein HDV00_009547 [Rhizophlyctis rosea]|nr:hypothetical protein HDV00_009547 [Rhizophlyctis rosea]
MPHEVPVHKPESLNPLKAPHAAPKAAPDPIRVSIAVKDPLDHSVPGILHASSTPSRLCAMLVSGAGGGVSGPMGMYVSLATRLASTAGVHALRLDYREPARNQYCVPDVLTAIQWMKQNYGCEKFVLSGWTFGGAPVFTVGAQTKGTVVGCATVASQTAETSPIRTLAPTPILLLHGTGDKCLPHRCAEQLYNQYGNSPKGSRDIVLYEGDDHGLSRNAADAEERIFAFFCRCLGVHHATTSLVQQRKIPPW